MRRFSILGLMGVVSAVAVAFAALRGANPRWAGAAHALTLGMIGFAVLASIRGRKGWLGFLVAGGGYFLAIRTLPAADVDLLPTSQVLTAIEAQIPGGMEVTTTFRPVDASTSPATVITTGTMRIEADNLIIRRSVALGKPAAGIWGSILPVGSNLLSFRAIAHDLFALVLGGLGAIVARRMWRQDPPSENDREPSRPAAPGEPLAELTLDRRPDPVRDAGKMPT